MAELLTFRKVDEGVVMERVDVRGVFRCVGEAVGEECIFAIHVGTSMGDGGLVVGGRVGECVGRMDEGCFLGWDQDEGVGWCKWVHK